ncbi:MAG: hypothetical protein KH828_05060 [Clostridiales bacterium]|nr:hypothetical protein [Clostridiales bacterium]
MNSNKFTEKMLFTNYILDISTNACYNGRRSEKEKVPITDGYVDYHREVGIHNGSTVWAAM